MTRKRFFGVAALAAIAALAIPPGAATAQEVPPFPKSPAQACRLLADLDPDAYAFLATQPGGCESSVASVGIEALMAGAFPSNAAAVGNCKAIEADVGGYPYQFYGFVPGTAHELYGFGAIDEATRDQILALYAERADFLLAENRADCLRVLRFFHSGGMDDIFSLFPPEPES